MAPDTRGSRVAVAVDVEERGEARRGVGRVGHEVVDRTVLRLLKGMGYSLQANKKTREGAQHPDRDAQFAHINETVARRSRRASR